MLNIALFGPPGAGKGTQSQKLLEKYNLGYIATGDILREEIREGSDLGLKAKAIIEQGGLVSDEIIVQIIEKKIQTNTQLDGFIFDGFPRTFVQAYILEGLLLKLHTSLNVLLSLEVPRNESVERLMERGKTSGRSDDNEVVINNRLDEYENKTLPVLDFYKERGKYVGILGVGSVDDVFARLTETIDIELNKHLLNVVMLGYPGSGRGTQAKKLAQKYSLNYISTGDILFDEMTRNTPVGEQIKPYIERGEIVPDEIVIRLIEKHIRDNTSARGFIFKGFPRTVVQAYILDGLLRKLGSSVSCIIDLEVPMLQLMKRLISRGNKENRIGETGTPEGIIDRLEAHEIQTLPVLNYFKKDREVTAVNGSGERDEIFESLSLVVEKAFKAVR